MSKKVGLLSRPINFAVVHLPERKYPGVVFQGDSLNALVQSLEQMSMLSENGQVDELAVEISEIREQLESALLHYEAVCAEHDIPLPYSKKKR